MAPAMVSVALNARVTALLKLLQSPAAELRRPLVAIWAAILAFDPSCRRDLVKDGAHLSFVAHLHALAAPGDPAEAASRAGLADAAELDEQRCLAAFVLAAVAQNLRGVVADLPPRHAGGIAGADQREAQVGEEEDVDHYLAIAGLRIVVRRVPDAHCAGAAGARAGARRARSSAGRVETTASSYCHKWYGCSREAHPAHCLSRGAWSRPQAGVMPVVLVPVPLVPVLMPTSTTNSALALAR